MKSKSLNSLVDIFSTALLKKHRHGLDKWVVTVIIFAFFVAVQGVWQWRQDRLDNVVVLLITYGAAFSFYYQRRDKLKFPENLFAQVVGCFILGSFVLRAQTLFKLDFLVYPHVFALVGSVGGVLLVAGFYGIKQFRRLLLAIFLLDGVVKIVFIVVQRLIPLRVISAKLSSYSLWYLGFEPVRRSSFIYVNQGVVDVNVGCTAYPLMWSCVQILVVAYIFLPIRFNQYSFLFDISLSFLVSFLLSIARICVMALVVSNPAQFEFWHGTSGSNLFTLPSLVFCGFLVFRRLPDRWDSTTVIVGTSNLAPTGSSWGFNGLASVFILGLVLLMLPHVGQRTIANNALPREIPLAQWRWQASHPLESSELLTMAKVMQTDSDDVQAMTLAVLAQQQSQQDGNDIPLTGQRYTYERDFSRLIMTLVYVVNSRAKAPFVGEGYVTQAANQRQIESLQREPAPRNDPPYLILSEHNSTQLLMCLASGGNSVVDSHTFMRLDRLRDKLLNPQKFYGWLIGDRPIWDHRCLWVHLRIDGQTPDARNQLVNVWQELINYWKFHFPPV